MKKNSAEYELSSWRCLRRKHNNQQRPFDKHKASVSPYVKCCGWTLDLQKFHRNPPSNGLQCSAKFRACLSCTWPVLVLDLSLLSSFWSGQAKHRFYAGMHLHMGSRDWCLAQGSDDIYSIWCQFDHLIMWWVMVAYAAFEVDSCRFNRLWQHQACIADDESTNLRLSLVWWGWHLSCFRLLLSTVSCHWSSTYCSPLSERSLLPP